MNNSLGFFSFKIIWPLVKLWVQKCFPSLPTTCTNWPLRSTKLFDHWLWSNIQPLVVAKIFYLLPFFVFKVASLRPATCTTLVWTTLGFGKIIRPLVKAQLLSLWSDSGFKVVSLLANHLHWHHHFDDLFLSALEIGSIF